MALLKPNYECRKSNGHPDNEVRGMGFGILARRQFRLRKILCKHHSSRNNKTMPVEDDISSIEMKKGRSRDAAPPVCMGRERRGGEVSKNVCMWAKVCTMKCLRHELGGGD